MNINTQFKTITDELKRLNAPTHILKEFQVFFTAFETLNTKFFDSDVLNQAFYDYLKRLNEKYIHDSEHLVTAKKENLEKLTVEKELSRIQYIETLNRIDEDYLQQKKVIEKKYQEDKQQLLNEIKSFENEKNKQNTSITRHIQEIKKHYETFVTKIEETTTSKIQEVTQNFKDQIIKIETLISELQNTHSEYLQQLVQHREIESKAHDTDYIDIKSHYNILNITLNKQINLLKLKKIKVLKELDEKYKDLVQPLDDRDLELFESSKQLKKERLKIRDTEIQKFQERIKTEIERHEATKKKTIVQNLEAVSLFNSKLSNYREITNEKKRQIVRDHQTQILVSSHETLQKNRKLAQLDNELNIFILKINKDIKQKKEESQLLLFELQKSHQILVADIEFLIKKEIYETALDLKQIDLHLKHEHELLHDQKQILLQEKKHYINAIENAFLKDIFAFETQIILASQTQERDLGQLVFDASIDMTQLDKNILDIQSKHDHIILMHQQQIDVLKFQMDQELNKINIVKTHQLDQSSRTRDLDLEESHLRLELKQETFDEQTALYKHQLETLFIIYEKALYHHEYRYEYQKESHKSNNDFKTTQLQLSINEYEHQFTLNRFNNDFLRSEKIIDTHVNQFYKLIQNLMATHFESTSVVMLCIQLLEQTFVYHEHPETMRQMIDLLVSVLITIQTKQKELIQQLKAELINRYQSHFDNAKKVVLNMRRKDEHILSSQYMTNLQQEKAELVKKRYDFEVSMKKSSKLKDPFALKRMEKSYAQTNVSIFTLEQKIKDASNQAQITFEQYQVKFNLFIEKKFTHHHHILKLLTKSETYMQDFYDVVSNQSQKLSQTLYYTHQVIFGMTKQTRKYYLKCVELQQQQLPKVYKHLLVYQRDMQAALIIEKKIKLSNIEHAIHEWQGKQKNLQAFFEQDEKFSRRNFRENIVAKNNDAEQKIANYHREFNESKDKRLKSIQKLEFALQSFAAKKSVTLETLILNHNIILEQENNRFELLEHSLKVHQQKSFENFDLTVLRKQNDYDEKIQQALNSIEQRLIKYLAFVEKLRSNFKDKIIDKTLYENKIRQSYKKRLMLSKQKTNTMMSLHKKEKRLHLIQWDKHEKREQLILNKKHQSIEFWLKKSYQFKIKTLNIH